MDSPGLGIQARRVAPFAARAISCAPIVLPIDPRRVSKRNGSFAAPAARRRFRNFADKSLRPSVRDSTDPTQGVIRARQEIGTLRGAAGTNCDYDKEENDSHGDS